MPALVPEKRVNVKGHLVTKHVRAGAPASKSGAAFPKPKLVPVAASQEATNPLDKRVALTMRNAASSDVSFYKAFAAQRGISEDMPKEAEMTTRLWYAAKRENLSNLAIFCLAATGVTDIAAMTEFSDKREPRSRRKETPGREMRRKRWIDNLVSEGVSYEMLMKASEKYDGLRIDQLSSPDADNCNAADVVRAYAEYQTGKNREMIIPLIWSGDLTYDQVKEYGATRISRHEPALRRFVIEDPHQMDQRSMSIEDFMAIVKKEEKSFSPLESNVQRRVAQRAETAIKWGSERAMALRTPGVMFNYRDDTLKQFTDMDRAYRFIQFHEEIQHQSILRGSVNSADADKIERCENFSSSKEYAHISESRFYKPDLKDTLPFFDMDLTPDETIAALERGQQAYMVRAKKEGNVQASLAEGWL